MKLVLLVALALVLVPAAAVPTASAIGPLCDTFTLNPFVVDCLPECKSQDLIITCRM